MDSDRMIEYLDRNYLPKREALVRIPLDVDQNKLWQRVQAHRREKSVTLPLNSARGIPFWYVVTDKMIEASNRLVDELLETEREIDPFKETPEISALEEVFYTSFVEGAQINMKDAMSFLQQQREPENTEEQLILNNLHAQSFARSYLYQPVDERLIQTIAFILTENLENGGQNYRKEDWINIESMGKENYDVPTAISIPDRVKEVIDFFSDEQIHPIIRAGIGQAWMLVIRPFPEGNERLARLLSTMIMIKNGYTFLGEISISAIIARTSYAYYKAIANILRPENGNDLTYFLEYYLSLLAEAVEERHRKLRNENNKETKVQIKKNEQQQLPEPESLDIEMDYCSDDETLWLLDEFSSIVEGDNKNLSDCASLMRQYLQDKKYIFCTQDVGEALGLSGNESKNLLVSFMMRKLIVSPGKVNGKSIYGFVKKNTDGSKSTICQKSQMLFLMCRYKTIINNPKASKASKISAQIAISCLESHRKITIEEVEEYLKVDREKANEILVHFVNMSLLEVSDQGFDFPGIPIKEGIVHREIERAEARDDIKDKLEDFVKQGRERSRDGAKLLLSYLEQNITAFTVLDVRMDLNSDMATAANLIARLKGKDIIEPVGKHGSYSVYGFVGVIPGEYRERTS